VDRINGKDGGECENRDVVSSRNEGQWTRVVVEDGNDITGRGSMMRMIDTSLIEAASSA